MTFATIIASLLCYAGAINLRRRHWRWSRCLWSVGVLACGAHVVCAFHFYHDWSHQKAFEHTERESGFGAGVFVNYLFLLVWAGDALYWWLAPSRYDERRAWIGFLVHSFLAFIIFSATVVFGAGGIRWFGAVMFAELGGSWILQRSRQQK